MQKIHLWVGTFASKKSFETYLDQRAYLKAWAIYDNEPLEDGEEDAEPSPALRCQFCKEVDLDGYDEDASIVKYVRAPVGVDLLCKDLPVEKDELRALFKRRRIGEANALIAYQAGDLTEKDASRATSMRYVGQVAPSSSDAKGKERRVHHLWTGMTRQSKARIVAALGVPAADIGSVNFVFAEQQKRLDEMIVTRVDDLAVAESMVLALDRMKIAPMAHAILDVVLNLNPDIDGEGVAAALALQYIGKFSAD